MDREQINHTLYSDIRYLAINLYYKKKYNFLSIVIFLAVFLSTVFTFIASPKELFLNTNRIQSIEDQKKSIIKSSNNGVKEIYTIQVFSSSYMNNSLSIMKMLRENGYQSTISLESPLFHIYVGQYIIKANGLKALDAFNNHFDGKFINKNRPFLKTL